MQIQPLIVIPPRQHNNVRAGRHGSTHGSTTEAEPALNPATLTTWKQQT